MKSRCHAITAALLFGSLPLWAADSAKQQQRATQPAPPPFQQNQQGQQEQPGAMGEQRRHRRPPQEAFTACKGQKEGAAVSIVTPRGDKVSGTCVKHGEDIFARPDQPPPDMGGEGGPQGGPPGGGQQGGGQPPKS